MINSLEELEKFANKKRNSDKIFSEELRVCTGSSCASLGSNEFKKKISEEVKNAKLDKQCNVKGVGCNGLCSSAIMVTHYKKENKEETIYGGLELSDSKKFIKILQKENVLEDKKCDITGAFFTKQKKIVLANAGIIDPDDIEDYIAYGGYTALFNALEYMGPEEIIKEVKLSGLRGRGGGGYPTGLKWESVAKIQSKQKYIVCNGDEGDLGAFMDRAVMEADPFRVIEGMSLAGYACGANKGYIYVRAEYPLAVKKLDNAIKQARKKGFLGNHIANSGFSFDIEIRLGAGAYVCGEATSLIASIEGNRGSPRQKPPHLSDHGLFGEPTLLNNVETFANIAPIIINGGAWYKEIGTQKSTGTKVFALTGNVKNTGLVEVPMGITIRELVYEIGGGIIGDKLLKAVQTGGPSGGCIPAKFLDMQVDYDSLKSLGTIMGSGGFIVMDEDINMVELAKFFIDFCKSESCGKCVPCRVGTTQISNLLDKFLKKEASKKDFELISKLSLAMSETSLCGLGQTAAKPVLSTIKYFENEYLEGIKND